MSKNAHFMPQRALNVHGSGACHGRCGSVAVDEGAGCVGFLDAVADEESVDAGILSAEAAVDYVGCLCSTLFKDVVAERIGCFAVEDAVLLE